MIHRMRLVCWPVWSAGPTGSVLGFGESGSEAFGSLGEGGGSGNCVADCAVVGESDGVCCAQSLLANGLASNRNGKKRISFLKILFPPPIIIPHHGDKFPGFLCRTAIAIRFRMRPGRCIYGTRGIVTAAAHSTERILSSRSIVCVAADFYEAQSVHKRRGSCYRPGCGRRNVARLRPRRF